MREINIIQPMRGIMMLMNANQETASWFATVQGSIESTNEDLAK